MENDSFRLVLIASSDSLRDVDLYTLLGVDWGEKGPFEKTVEMDGKNIKLEIHLRYSRVKADKPLHDSHLFEGVVMVYNVADWRSFSGLGFGGGIWNYLITREKLLLLGLTEANRKKVVLIKDGMELAQSCYIPRFLETNPENINEVFELLVRSILWKKLRGSKQRGLPTLKLYNHTFTVILIGVGKGDLLSKYTECVHVGTVFKYNKLIELEGKIIELQILVDYAERFMDRIGSSLHSSGIILVYDITKHWTFVEIKQWLQCHKHTFSDVECLLIGNNSHLEEQQEVPREECIELARHYGIPFLETSAKTGHNVFEAFELLARLMLHKQTQQTHTQELQGISAVMVGEDRQSGMPRDHLLKLMLVGDSGVGKADILSTYTDELFIHTRDINIMTKTIELKGIKTKIVVWEKGVAPAFIFYQDIPPVYYEVSMGIILVYDITSQKSFKSIKKWLQRVKKHASSDVECLLIGNNSHLEEQREVLREDGEELARQLGIPFLETSAKTNYNIDKAFEQLAKLILMKEMNESEKHLMALETTLEKKRHLEAFETALEEKGSLEQTIIHCLFFGHPRGGKSSLMKRLTGHPPTPNTSSTGVAEKVEVCTSTAVSSHSQWSTLTLDDEAIALMAIASQTFPVETGPARPASLEHGTTDHDATPPTDSDATLPTSDVVTPSTDESRSPESSEATPAISDEAPLIAPSANSSASRNLAEVDVSPQLPDDYSPPMEVLKKAIMLKGLEGIEQYLQGSLTLYLTDTGGQMEFQELLPALVAGPSIFFVVFRLDQDLNKTFTIEYLHPNGQSAEPYPSSFSVKETLLQSLTSIASMGTYVYSKRLKKQISLKPKVVLVGTHKDRVSRRKIAQINRELLQMIKATSLFRDGLIEFASESQLVITVNNLSRNTSDFQLVRSVVERIAERGDFKVSSPSTWLIFTLLIRQQKKRVITYDECFGIAQKCGINSREELNEALWFLNTKLGLVRHFRGEGLEELEEIVIIDPQILFDKITKLIVQTFTFQKVTADVHEEFKRKGIFPLSVLVQLSSSDDEDQLLTVSRLVKLLEHLHIIARLHSDSEREVKYFMPCALAHAGSTAPVLTDLTSLLAYLKRFIFGEDSRMLIPSLLVTFKCGCCPKGLFSALCVYLLANKMKSHLNWKLQTDQIFKNALSLAVGPFDTMTLSSTPTYMEVSVVPASKDQDRVFPIEETCTEVRRCIETAVREVTSSLNYTWDAEHALAFYCPGDHEGLKDKHPAIIQYYNNKPVNILCELTQQKSPCNLPKRHRNWFYEHSAIAAEASDTYHSPEMNSEDMDHTELHETIAPAPTLKLLQNLERGGERLRLVSELIPYWEELAIELNFPTYTIEKIRSERPLKPEDQCRDMLSTWLRQSSDSSPPEKPTWESLITAMKNISLIVLANRLERMIKAPQ